MKSIRYQSMKKNLTAILMTLLPFMLIACSKQQTSTEQTIQQPQVTNTLKSPDNSAPTTTSPPSNSNNYSSNNKNPFQAQPNVPNNSVTTPAQNMNQYAVSDLRMVGTITSDSQLYAIIASPDGSTSTVTIGDKIGKENAEVTDISTNQVILKIMLNFNGTTYQQLIELTLSNQSTPSSPGISA